MHIIRAQYIPVIDLQKVKMFPCGLSENFLYLDGKTVGSRCKRLRKAFDDPMLELHLSFYTATLPIFTHYNLFLQHYNLFFQPCFKDKRFSFFLFQIVPAS